MLKLIGYEVVELKATNSYTWKPKGSITYYPSQTFKGDTTGASNEIEFLMFRDDIVNRQNEVFKLFRKDWVSNADYSQFIRWVRDSTILELVYINNDPTGSDAIPDELIGEMLIHPEIYYDSINDFETNFDPTQPSINRPLFPLSWEMKGITDQQIIPLISEMYLPIHERFNYFKDWDERKLIHGIKGSGTEVLITPDRDSWAAKSEHPYDIYYNMANYYSVSAGSANYPAVGLLASQIKPFLEYQERELQKKLDAKGFNYTVRLSLPTQEEIKLADTSTCDCNQSFVFDEKDMTSQWQIKNNEYWDFVLWVQDSIFRTLIYSNNDPTGKNAIEDEVIGEMLNYPEVYFDEVNLAWQEFDCAQPFVNRELYSFDWEFDWKKKITPEQYLPLLEDCFIDPEDMVDSKGAIDYKNFDFRKCFYIYDWQDIAGRAETGDLIWDEVNGCFETRGVGHGKPLVTDRKNLPENKTGVRRHEDLSRFIIRENVNIYPGANCSYCNKICANEHGNFLNSDEKDSICNKCPEGLENALNEYDFWTKPEGLVTGLSYAQATAFYNWKYHKNNQWNKDETSPYDDLVPSEEEFIKIQQGESVVIKEQKLEYPSPLFRYVIHFYPKN